MKIFFSIILSVFLLFSLNSCSHSKKIKKDVPTEAPVSLAEKGYVPATVLNYTVDGCTWVLQLDETTKIQPLNLKEEFQKDKLNVWVKYQIKKGAVGFCMVGDIVTIIDIQVK